MIMYYVCGLYFEVAFLVYISTNVFTAFFIDKRLEFISFDLEDVMYINPTCILLFSTLIIKKKSEDKITKFGFVKF